MFLLSINEMKSRANDLIPEKKMKILPAKK